MSIATVINADARRLPLWDGSVHCVITSPPYFGLRDYGTATWEGGSKGCDHEPPQDWIDRNFNAKSAFGNGALTQSAAAKLRWFNADGSCKCGARRVDRQIGLEASPDLFVAAMVRVFREVKRVLRDDGCLWLNIGDSYATDTAGWRKESWSAGGSGIKKRTGIPLGLKSKDLIGIPWRLAFALQDDGWYLRSDIIWSKPNPMPESVTDRPTKSHEYVFLLTKSERYFWDQEAVREANKPYKIPDGGIATTETGKAYKEQWINRKGRASRAALYNPAGRNVRSVWTIPTHAFPGAHFATFPPALVERCVKAGTSERGCCPTCGAPWERVTQTDYVPNPGHMWGGIGDSERNPATRTDLPKESRLPVKTTLGWSPSCSCHVHKPIPCIVLDPFCGSGTTGVVATGLGRKFVGVDLSPDYCKMAVRRISRPHASHRTAKQEHHPLFAGMAE